MRLGSNIGARALPAATAPNSRCRKPELMREQTSGAPLCLGGTDAAANALEDLHVGEELTSAAGRQSADCDI